MTEAAWHNHLKSLGAKFADHNGSSLVIGFGGTAETEPSNRDCFLAPLSHLGLLQVKGADSKRFLQGQLTCDLDEVTPKASRLGAACTPAGRVYSNFRIFDSAGEQIPEYLLSMRENIVESSRSQLGKYIVFYKAEMANNTGEYVALGLWGKNSGKSIAAVFSRPPESINQVVHDNSAFAVLLPGDIPRYQIWAKPDHACELWQQLASKSHIKTTLDWIVQDINQGLADVTPATAERFTPHALNYPQNEAISFTKGCYTGQEIIARMHYRGAAKSSLAHLSFSSKGTFAAGQEIQLQNNAKALVLEAVQDQVQITQALVTAPANAVESDEIILSLEEDRTRARCHPFSSIPE